MNHDGGAPSPVSGIGFARSGGASLQVPGQSFALSHDGNLAIVAALVLPVAGPRSLASRSPRLEILRACLLLGSTLLNFTAVKYLPLTVTA